MTQNRELILADFQACTGIDDVAVAIYHLEEAQWDLVAAVNHAMPQEQLATEHMSSPVVEMPPENDQGTADDAALPPPIQMDHHVMDHVPSTSTSMSEPSSSQGSDNKHKDLNFRIKYNQKTLNISLSANKSLADLKTKIFKQTGVPQTQQMLSGWRLNPRTECLPLSMLNLPRLNSLNLAVLPTVAMADKKVAERLSLTYTLIVKYGEKEYSLKFPGSRTVLEVKNDVYTFTDIPVRHQVWTGWPETVTDDKIMLASADLDHPEHRLTVTPAPTPTCPSPPSDAKHKVNSDSHDIDNSEEEFEDASESFTGDEDQDYMMDDVTSKKLQPLIPPDTEDEMLGTIHFAEEFTNRYGGAHPHFFPGTLEDALKESCLKPAKDRRLLAVYLHHDWSVLSNVFCTQLLGFESVLQHLSNYFVVWGWDLTHESNKNTLYESVNRNLGKMAEMTIRRIETNKLPALIIIMRIRSSTEIFTIVHGNVGANELLTSLMQAVDVFTEQQATYLRDEEERAAREMIKTEQDKAYQASLAVDRAKEESKKQQELLQERERERIEHERQQQEAIREAHRQEVERELPPEPEEGAGDSITKIRYRLPGGRSIERRFRVTDTLKALLDFLTVEGFPTDSYKVISGWPRRDLTTLDKGQTLSELKLCPQETVIIEER